MMLLMLVLLLLAAGVACLLGLTVDTRDTAYGRVVEFCDPCDRAAR